MKMKNKYISVVLLVIPLLLSACSDLSEINTRLDDHEKRLKNLESLVSNANSTIKNIQDLLDAEAQKVTIDSFEETPNGYVLYMSDGSQINLSNGKDGTSPVIGVKEENDVLYWTINGEFILDADGNKIKAEGQDGSNGVTPKIRVDGEGYWEFSIDGGKTWQAITDESGQKVKAVGSDATIDLVITEDENAITIVYDGNTFIIPKNSSNSDPTPIGRPKLPIEYFAEYDLAEDGNSFVSSHANDAPGLFQWQTAVAYFGEKVIEGKKYRVPTQNEMHAIVGKYGIYYMEPEYDTDLSDGEITVNGETLEYNTDYKCVEEYKVYAIRFKGHGDKWLSAYRYEFKDNPDSPDGKLLEVRVRYLGPDSSITIDDIAKEDYWTTDAENDAVRLFPTSGWRNKWEDKRYNVGSQGSFFSKSENSMGRPWSMDFQKSRAYMFDSNDKMDYAALRLIEIE